MLDLAFNFIFMAEKRKVAAKTVKTTTKTKLTKPKNNFTLELQQYFSEFLGTGILTFLVTFGVGFGDTFLATPLLASLILAMMVYTLGAVSGAHFNPAITLGLFVTRAIHYKTAIFYVLAQLTGAMFAVSLYYSMSLPLPAANMDHSSLLLTFEALGTAILAFGVSAVANGKITQSASGFVVGGSLLVGATLAGTLTFGLLNPAIATSWGLFTPTYIVGPFAGAIIGAVIYKLLTVKPNL